MIILLIGGSKSSKSSFGELFASKLNKDGKLYYIATMKPYDLEDLKRVENHIKARKKYNFITIEKHKDLYELKGKISLKDTALLDSVTSLVTNEMFLNEDYYNFNEDKIKSEVKFLSEKLNNLIIVSDNISSDSNKYDKVTENFRKELGRINTYIASFSDIVIEVSYGNLIIHKGREIFKNEKFI